MSRPAGGLEGRDHLNVVISELTYVGECHGKKTFNVPPANAVGIVRKQEGAGRAPCLNNDDVC